jgi:hypothetical protein
MRFMVLVYPGKTADYEAGAMPSEKIVNEMMDFNEELGRAGVLVSGDGLRPTRDGARVSTSGGKPTVTDGPFAESKEILGGFWMWQVGSKEEAIEWAKRCPLEDGDVLEIRQVFEIEEFGEDVARRSEEIKRLTPAS